MNSNIRQILDNVLIGLTLIAFLVCFGFGMYFYYKAKSTQASYDNLRVQSQNRIAELSRTVQENQTTWSRLAQEKDDQIQQLRHQVPELQALISSRNEQIQNLTTAVAQLQAINVRLRNQHDVHQSDVPGTEPGTVRHRVDFDHTQDIVRISGYTMTDPSEANIDIQFTRPVNITMVTTQRPDLSWNTYVNTDSSLIRIGNIQSSVNPLARPQQVHHWEEDIFIAGGMAVGLDGHAGYGDLGVGYDFGSIEAEIDASLIAYPQGVSFALGAQVRFSPFGL